MKIYNLSSGSKGNVSLVVCGSYKILIDAGTTKKYLVSSLNEIGYTLEDIDLVLVTHYHSDHAKALNAFKTNKIMSNKEEDMHCLLKVNELNQYDKVCIRPFLLSHDSLCYGYQIKYNDETLTYITDTGYVKKVYETYISEADYLYLEFNHDIVKLNQTSRPPYLKQRILSDLGHMNNHDAALIVCKSASSKLKQLIVAHISDEANTVELIQNEIENVYSAFKKDINFDIFYTAHETIVKAGSSNED
ncbi:MBL fold metallo-hydrolase [Mycoplasma sp. P36-A1]|uniref:MBL fold metallo-hydrolase n=1 Tax=Mycoplasma sp. P36-A1 TaxID=3252900 RepID=UPI003C2FD79E